MTDPLEFSLANTPPFACLPVEDRSRLAKLASVVALSAGDILFREGDASDDFYVVLSGKLEVVKAVDTPEESLAGICGEGEFVGEMGLLNQNGLRTATVRALAAARLLRVPVTEFNELVAHSSDFSCHLASVLSSRLTTHRENALQSLSEKNRQLQQAYDELKAAQRELIEKKSLEHELMLARDIQRSILPTRFPQFAGYDFGGLMLPARAVGGDFFGLFPLDQERMALVVGDVMGKGIPAAIFMAQTYALLRATAQADLSPGETLRRVNRLLLKMSDSGLFATMVYGVQHAATGAWHYARAGHELPMVLSVQGEVRLAPMQEGMPLGIMEETVLDEGCLELHQGEVLLLFTDGVTDGTDRDGNHFDHWRLETALQGAAGQDAEQVCQTILRAVREFQQDETQFDDITLLAVRRRPASL